MVSSNRDRLVLEWFKYPQVQIQIRAFSVPESVLESYIISSNNHLMAGKSKQDIISRPVIATTFRFFAHLTLRILKSSMTFKVKSQ